MIFGIFYFQMKAISNKMLHTLLLAKSEGRASPHHLHHSSSTHAHHHSHHHHHIHFDRKRSECVHPETDVAHAPSHPHTKHPDIQNRTLDEVCIDGIHFT